MHPVILAILFVAVLLMLVFILQAWQRQIEADTEQRLLQSARDALEADGKHP